MKMSRMAETSMKIDQAKPVSRPLCRSLRMAIGPWYDWVRV
jgi:hypothetical protein